jgi:hypothetical protein
MRLATMIAVVLAVLGAALAGVKEQSESCRLQRHPAAGAPS